MESFGQLGNNNMVSEGMQAPDGEEQRVRYRRQFGAFSLDLNGNLPRYSLCHEVPCGPC